MEQQNPSAMHQPADDTSVRPEEASDQSIQASLEGLAKAVAAVADSYTDLLLLELRTAANAAGLFIAVNVLIALFGAIAWVAAFTTFGLMIVGIVSTVTAVAAFVALGALTGAYFCWMARRSLWRWMRDVYPEILKSNLSKKEEQSDAHCKIK